MSTYPPRLAMRLDAQSLRTAPARSTAWMAVLVLGWPVLASADCVDTRKATAGEIEFHSRAVAALVAALPAVPVGGKLQNEDSVPTLGQQCQGRTGDFNLQVSRFYELDHRKSIVSVAMNVRQLPLTASGPFAAYGAASPNRSAALKVNNVVWTITGSDSPLRQALADSVDRTRLQALVGQPLPSVAESRAVAAQAVAATVAGKATAAPPERMPNVPSTETAMQPAAPTSPPAPAAAGQAAGSEPVKDAVETFNKLRGLFGR